MKRTTHTILALPFRTLLKLWWPLLGRLKRKALPKRALVCVVNDLMAAHVAPVADLLRSDDRIDWRVTAPGGLRSSGTSLQKISEKMQMPPVNYALSRMRWWDLIIYAEHRGVDQYHPSIPKLMIQHGYDSGKLFDGEDIRYGPRSMYRGDNGKPRYRRILESSETTCQKAIAADPKLDGRIAVVGDVGADRMLDLVRRRREIRQELGYSDADIVVLLMGTWRQDSLMESAGRELVAEAIRLRGQYQFVFSTHPLHWKGEYAAKHPWGKFLLENRQPGIAVVEPDDDGEKAAIAADILIADHTSLAVKYALLKKPLLLWERREGLVAPGTFGDRIYQALPHVHGVKDLGNALETARQWYPMERLSAFADEINSYPGQAAARIRQEVLQLLNL